MAIHTRRYFIGVLIGAVVLTLLQALAAVSLPLKLPPVSGTMAWWALASNILVAGVLTPLVLRSVWSGWRLVGSVFVVLYALYHFNGLMEALFFDLFRDRMTGLILLLHGLVAAAGFAPAIVLLSGKLRPRPGEPKPRPVANLLTRLAASSVLYVTLYFAAGVMAYPHIRQFYEHKQVPSPLVLAAIQLFLRGPIFAVTMLLIVRMLREPRAVLAVFAGLVMATLGGLAPLLIPNPFLPDAVRIVHLVEVTTENFIFGCVAGWLLAPTAWEPSAADSLAPGYSPMTRDTAAPSR